MTGSARIPGPLLRFALGLLSPKSNSTSSKPMRGIGEGFGVVDSIVASAKLFLLLLSVDYCAAEEGDGTAPCGGGLLL